MADAAETVDVEAMEEPNGPRKPAVRKPIRWNLFAKEFDTRSKRIGYFYGRLAISYPWQCMLSGIFISLLFAIPFVMAFMNGIRDKKTNPNRGLALRTDVYVWLPSTSLQTMYASRVVKISDASDKHKEDFGSTVFRGRLGSEANEQSRVSACTGRDEDSEEIVLLYYHPGRELCTEENLKAIFEYENYIDTWQSPDGFAYRPDFCPIDNEELARFEGCGDYKGEDIGLPRCRRAHYDHHCRAPACLDYDAATTTSGCSSKRPAPDHSGRVTRWCYVGSVLNNGTTRPILHDACYDGDAPLQSLCSDAKAVNGLDGVLYWSETACVEGEGLGISQLSEADWCKPRVSIFDTYQSILKGAHYDVNLQYDDDFELAVRGWTASSSGTPAVCALENRPGKMCRRINGVRQEIPPASSSTLMSAFQMLPVFATYFSNILMQADFKDERAIKNCPRFSNAYCDGVAPPPFILPNITLGSGCVDNDSALSNLLRLLRVPNAAAITCVMAVASGWCEITDRKSSCYDVRLACPLSCKNEQLCPTNNTTCDAASTSGCRSFSSKETCPSGCNWHSTEIADRTTTNISEGCWECDDSRVSLVKDWALARQFCCDGRECSGEQGADLCSCFKDVNFCTLFGNIGRELCPQQCYAACSLISPRPKCCTFSNTECASANDHGCMVVGNVCTQRPPARRLTSENMQRRLSGTEVPLDCEPSVNTEDVSCACDYTEDASRARHPDIHNNLYKSDECESIISTRTLRRECHLDGYFYKKMIHPNVGDELLRTPPTLVQREKYSLEFMEEYVKNWKNDVPIENMAPADQLLKKNGIELGLYTHRLFRQEVIEIVTSELRPLIGTFTLMIIFMLCSVGVRDIRWIWGIPLVTFSWKRALLCCLVVIQPVLATLMAWGLGSVPIWPVPGDIEDDGVEDGVLPLSILSPMFMHLMLAIIVDFDIILVRSFDRMCLSVPFEQRFEYAIGYAHRTISLSMICGALAFAFGAWVDLPIVVYFCWQSFLGMVGLYLVLFTVFLGAFVLLERGRVFTEKELEEGTSEVVLNFRKSKNKAIHKRVSTIAPGATSQSLCIANLRASVSLSGSMGKRTSEAYSGSVETADAGMKLLIVTNFNDQQVASWFGRWSVLYISIAIEILILLASMAVLFTTGMKTSVDTTQFLPSNSRVRWYTDKSRAMGGTNDIIHLALPPSEIGHYHFQKHREYYFSVFDKIRKHPIAKPTGMPGTLSWLTSFEMFHRGTIDDPIAVVPPKDAYQQYSTPTCSGCPLEQFIRNDAQLDITQDDLGLLDTVLLPQLSLHRKFNFVNVSISNNNEANAWLRDLEISEVVAMGDPNAHRAWHEDVVYTQDPIVAGTSLRQFRSPASLVAALKATPVPFQIRFRSRLKTKYRVQRQLSKVREQCSLHESSYSLRAKYWDTHPADFYEYLHDWFWDQKADWSEGSVCCESDLDGDASVLGKRGPNYNVPHATPYGPEGEIIEWEYDKNTLHVTGIRASILRVYVKWPTAFSQQQESLRSMQNILDNERFSLATMAMWSQYDLKNFIFADKFVEATRDKDVPVFLTHHLQNVAIGVILVCMALLHPLYGFAVGFFLAVINFQVLGLLTAFGIDVDVVAFGVITMAIGFEIEYVVHIAHAFMYQDSRGFHRMYDASKEMALTVFLAFLSTAVQQIFFLIFTDGWSFTVYCGVMLLIIIKSGMTGFLLVPGILGVLDEKLALAEGLGEPEEKKESEEDESSEEESDSVSEAERRTEDGEVAREEDHI